MVFWRNMANKNEDVRVNLSQRIQALLEQFNALKHENAELQKELEWRRKEMAQQSEKLVALQKEADRLRCLYGMLDDKSEAKAFARQKIGKMVREIDKCLQLLLG